MHLSLCHEIISGYISLPLLVIPVGCKGPGRAGLGLTENPVLAKQ